MVAAELLGFEDYIPAFASSIGEQSLKGVNYASGGGGILEETGFHLVIPTLYYILDMHVNHLIYMHPN